MFVQRPLATGKAQEVESTDVHYETDQSDEPEPGQLGQQSHDELSYGCQEGHGVKPSGRARRSVQVDLLLVTIHPGSAVTSSRTS